MDNASYQMSAPVTLDGKPMQMQFYKIGLNKGLFSLHITGMVSIVEPALTCLVVVMVVVLTLPLMCLSHSSATVRRVGKEPSVISVSEQNKKLGCEI